jgi:hypothetical protein
MNNLRLYDGQLTVKCDARTQAVLTDWVDTKRGEYIQRQERLGVEVDSFEGLLAREKKGEVMQYELMLIP